MRTFDLREHAKQRYRLQQPWGAGPPLGARGPVLLAVSRCPVIPDLAAQRTFARGAHSQAQARRFSKQGSWGTWAPIGGCVSPARPAPLPMPLLLLMTSEPRLAEGAGIQYRQRTAEASRSNVPTPLRDPNLQECASADHKGYTVVARIF